MKLRHRQTVRATSRRPFRGLNRSSLRGRRRGPDDLSQAFTAYRKAIRAQRKLARLAPRFFDAAVVDRERENRAEKRRWMASWEPHIAKAYGVDPAPPDDSADLPSLPSPRTQRAVERELAAWDFWLAAGRAALERHQQRRPHALPGWSRLARWLNLAFDFKRLALGLDSKNPLPEKITYDDEFTDLKRAYGHLVDPPSAVDGVQSETMTRGAATMPAPVLPMVPVDPPAAVLIGGASVPASRLPLDSDAMSVVVGGDGALRRPVDACPETPPAPRCDAWRRWARQQCRRRP